MRKHQRGHTHALLALLAGTMIATAASAVEPAVVMSRGIVVDVESDTAFIADGAGHTQALALATGAPQWRSGDVGLPLALANGRLLVLAGHIGNQPDRVVLLDPEDGEQRGEIELALPTGVHAVVTALPNKRFDVSISPIANGVRLHWEYSESALRGDLPESGATPGSSMLTGAIDLDLASVQSTTTAATEASTFPRIAPNLQSNERLPGISGQQFRAANELHVLASEPVTDPLFGTAYRWHIHLRANAEKLGSVQMPHATAAFIVRDNTLLARIAPYASRRASGEMQYRNSRIAAFDLTTGQELWSRDVLEDRFLGLMPP